MRKLGKVLSFAVIAVVVFLAIGISLTVGWRPFIGPKARPLTSRKFESTPQRLERGRYIFNSLSLCLDCHSEHDFSQKDHPVIANMQGAGEVMPVTNLP